MSISLLEALRSERERVAVPRCKVCFWLSKQEIDVIAQVNDWISDGLEVKPLWHILSDNGMPGVYTTFRNHVQGCNALGNTK